jgi:hypothetical protein
VDAAAGDRLGQTVEAGRPGQVVVDAGDSLQRLAVVAVENMFVPVVAVAGSTRTVVAAVAVAVGRPGQTVVVVGSSSEEAAAAVPAGTLADGREGRGELQHRGRGLVAVAVAVAAAAAGMAGIDTDSGPVDTPVAAAVEVAVGTEERMKLLVCMVVLVYRGQMEQDKPALKGKTLLAAQCSQQKLDVVAMHRFASVQATGN